MKTSTETIYKVEALRKLSSVKRRAAKINSQLESNYDWKAVHEQIEKAIFELQITINLIVKNHVENCVFSRYKKEHSPIDQKGIEEVVKAYRYLG